MQYDQFPVIAPVIGARMARALDGAMGLRSGGGACGYWKKRWKKLFIFSKS